MRDEQVRPGQTVVRGPGDDKTDSVQSLLMITHVVYALHAFAVVSGVMGSVAILISFLASIPSIIAVIINYVKRSAVRGTWLESHFTWQIRTFWYAALWFLVGVMAIFSIIGAIPGFILLVGATIWVVYRIVRGWWALLNGRTMPLP